MDHDDAPAYRAAADAVAAQAVRGWRIARNLVIDLREGSVLGGIYFRNRAGSNSDYRALDLIFAGHVRADDVLADIGCGTGRVLSWWLRTHPGQAAIGIEANEEVGGATRDRLAGRPEVTVTIGDAAELYPADATLLYMFNPFPEPVVERFRERMKAEAREPERTRLLYYNCKHLAGFEADPAFTVERVTLPAPRVAPLQELAIIRFA